jgi:hypothetical protein
MIIGHGRMIAVGFRIHHREFNSSLLTAMKRILLAATLIAILRLGTTPLAASSLARISTRQHVDTAAAIGRATVLQVTSFRAADGVIRTRTLVRIDVVLKGVLPPVLQLVHVGGRVEDEGSEDGLAPKFVVGEARLLFLARDADGEAVALNGFASAPRLTRTDAGFTTVGGRLLDEVRLLAGKAGALPGGDFTDQAGQWSGLVPVLNAPPPPDTSGLITDQNSGAPSRYLAPDRGEPIEYIVDAATLPAGMTLTAATNALANAFAAWSAVSSLRFKFVGFETFAQASPNIAIKDGRIRVQLHDTFNYILSSSTLGIGGRSYAVSSAFPSGGMGGRVGALECYPNNFGYVVLNHRSVSMQNLATFEEVLCHEIGHSLGLAHSSENPSEPNQVLVEAMMYFQQHVPPRGAVLGSYDPPILRKVHPLNNTPPYGYDRVMDVVAASPQPNVAGVNSITATGYDLQGDTLTGSLEGPTSNNGTFSMNGGLLRFTPAGAFPTSIRIDPATPGAWDSAILRFDDGVHASPYVAVRVLSFNLDTKPTGAVDGMPDWWTQQHFNSTTPTAGAKTRAQDDFDGDTLTNLEEWLAGTDPKTASSKLQITSFNGATLGFDARAYEVYELMGTTDFITWTRAANPGSPKTAVGTFSGAGASTGHKFFQVRRVP